MSDHYFRSSPQSPSDPFEVEIRVLGTSLTLRSDRGVFSAQRLDTGSRLLAETVRAHPGETTLDLGCGIGALGILAGLASGAPVVFIDCNERAAALARANAARAGLGENALVVCGDGASALADESVDLVLLNPPIRAGRAVVRRLIEDAGRVLRPGGRLGMVALTRQGAETLARLVAERLGPPVLAARGSGYRVYVAHKP